MPAVLQAWWCLASASASASASRFQLANQGSRDPPAQQSNGRGQQKSGRGGAMREGSGRQQNGAMRGGKGRRESGAEAAGKSARNGRTCLDDLPQKRAEPLPDFFFSMFSDYPPIPRSGDRSGMGRRRRTGDELGSLLCRDAEIASRRQSRSVGSRSSPSRSSIPAKFSKYSKEVGGTAGRGNGIRGKSSTGLVSLPWLPLDKAEAEASEFERDASHSEVGSSSDASRLSSDYPRARSPAVRLSYQPKKDANPDKNDESANFVHNEDEEVAQNEKNGRDDANAASSDRSNSAAAPRVAHAENCQASSSAAHPLSDLPFEFRYSYSETPKAAPLRYREPQFSPFGPTTMGRPWTGRAPLKPSRKKVPEFDSFSPPPSGKKRVKHVQSPGPFIEGRDPREAKSREEILGEPLSKEEVSALVSSCMREQRQVNLGRDGLTHNMLDLVHTHWKRRRVSRIKCKGVPTVDMDNVCFHLEDKIGGKIIHRAGGVVYLFRGRYYNYRYRPKIPLMLWKPAAPVYPRLIQPAPGGLTKEEANELIRIGRKVVPICKLGKNGVYLNLVKDVRGAFKVDELVRINCQGLNPSDYKKIGAKLQDLVPCVLLSFEKERILMWRGRQSNCSPVADDHTERADIAQNTTIELEPGAVHVQHMANELIPGREDSFFDTSTCSTHSDDLSSEKVDGISSDSLTSCNAASIANLPNSAANKNVLPCFNFIDSIDTVSDLCENAELTACSDVSYATTNSFDEGSPLDSTAFSGSTFSSVQEAIVSDNLISEAFNDLPEQPFTSGSVCASDKKYVKGVGIQLEEAYTTVERNLEVNNEVRDDSEGVDCLWKQAIETGKALVLDDMNLDSDLVFAKASHFSKTAPQGPSYTHMLLHIFGPTESNIEHLSEISNESKNIKRRDRRMPKKKAMQTANPPLLEVPAPGGLALDDLARLLAP